MKVYNQLNLQLKFAMRINFALATLAAATYAIDLQMELFTEVFLDDDEASIDKAEKKRVFTNVHEAG